jgi:7-cyano-7-deazaguanine synthase
VAAGNVARHFGIPLSVIRVAGLEPLVAGNGFVMGRNMALCLLALMNVRHKETTISLGIHSGSIYCDCSPEFVSLAQEVADLYTQGIVTIAAPFLTRDKVDVAIYCLRNHLPRELTYSCDLGLDQPCGRCASCKALLELFPPT